LHLDSLLSVRCLLRQELYWRAIHPSPRPHLRSRRCGGYRHFMDTGDLTRRPAGTVLRATGPDDLAPVRGAVSQVAGAAGMDPIRVERLVVAVHEIVTNALVHGRPPATVTLAVTAGALVVTGHDQVAPAPRVS